MVADILKQLIKNRSSVGTVVILEVTGFEIFEKLLAAVVFTGLEFPKKELLF